jgi:hypothetical protein
MQILQLLTDLLTNLINKSSLILLFFSSLYSLRTLIFFLMAIKNGEQFKLTNKQLMYLGLGISIIITMIISGTKLI